MNEIIDAGAPAESVDGDVFEHADGPPAVKTPGGDIELDARGRLALYLAVGLAAGAVIALQIDIMRVFAVGNWTHFGSLVVSLAMLGFGLTSAVMAVAKNWFARNWRVAASVALGLYGPMAVGANLYIQQLGFNPIYLVSDPNQKWKLAEIFLAALTPFLAGAVFLGCVFLKSNKTFGRVYFADLAGSGLSGLVFLGAMYLLPPINLIAAPLALWFAACVAWSFIPGARGALVPFVVMAGLAFGGHFVAAPELGLSRLAVNDYKGASYARRLPEAKKVFESYSPFGLLEAYTTSYLHFAPGLSDNAGFNLPTMPANAYMGLYIDSDGPIGVMRHLDAKESAYFRFLPMYYPYVIKKAAEDLHHPVRRRHLDGSRSQHGLEGRDRRGGQSRDPGGVPRPRVQEFHRRHPQQGARDRLRRPAFPSADEGEIRRHRPEPGRFHGSFQSRGLRSGREVRLYAGGDGDLYARAERRRRVGGHDLEQGRTAQVGSQALRDDGGGFARHRRAAHGRFVLRLVILSLDRHGALQARRIHRG